VLTLTHCNGISFSRDCLRALYRGTDLPKEILPSWAYIPVLIPENRIMQSNAEATLRIVLIFICSFDEFFLYQEIKGKDQELIQKCRGEALPIHQMALHRQKSWPMPYIGFEMFIWPGDYEINLSRRTYPSSNRSHHHRLQRF
jgi:hypothetical protein